MPAFVGASGSARGNAAGALVIRRTFVGLGGESDQGGGRAQAANFRVLLASPAATSSFALPPTLANDELERLQSRERQRRCRLRKKLQRRARGEASREVESASENDASDADAKCEGAQDDAGHERGYLLSADRRAGASFVAQIAYADLRHGRSQGEGNDDEEEEEEGEGEDENDEE